jgi:hypothetical protein
MWAVMASAVVDAHSDIDVRYPPPPPRPVPCAGTVDLGDDNCDQGPLIRVWPLNRGGGE